LDESPIRKSNPNVVTNKEKHILRYKHDIPKSPSSKQSKTKNQDPEPSDGNTSDETPENTIIHDDQNKSPSDNTSCKDLDRHKPKYTLSYTAPKNTANSKMQEAVSQPYETSQELVSLKNINTDSSVNHVCYCIIYYSIVHTEYFINY
jgi:hypothetical protein